MGTDYQKQKPVFKIKLKTVIPLVVVGIAIIILFFKVASIEKGVNALKALSVWFVFLALIAQVCSYLGSGYLLKMIMYRTRSQLTIARGALITMAAASIGLLAGGWFSSAAATYYWVSRNNENPGQAALTGVLPPLYNSIILTIVTIIGMLYMLFNRSLSLAQIWLYGLVLVIIIIITLLMLYGLIRRRKVENLALFIIKKVTHLLKRDFDPIIIRNRMDDFYDALKLLTRHNLLKLSLGSFINIFFDMMTLFFFFKSAGYLITPSILIAGYGIAFLLARGAFFIPGGIGVIEAGMVAIYTSLGVPGGISLVSVLGYRLVSFWIPILLGFVAMIYLKKTSKKPRKPKRHLYRNMKTQLQDFLR